MMKTIIYDRRNNLKSILDNITAHDFILKLYCKKKILYIGRILNKNENNVQSLRKKDFLKFYYIDQPEIL